MNSFIEHEKEIASLPSVSKSRGGAHRSLYLLSALRRVRAKRRASHHTKKAPVRVPFSWWRICNVNRTHYKSVRPSRYSIVQSNNFDNETKFSVSGNLPCNNHCEIVDC